MTDQTTTAPVWQDGDPLMEAIAAAVWEHCHTAGPCVDDDPRNIAAAAVVGIRDAARQAASFGAALDGNTTPKAASNGAARQAAGHACGNCDGIDPGTCLTNPDRQAPGQPQHHIPCGPCGAPWSDGHGQPGDPCPAAGQIHTTEQPVVAYRDPNNPRVLLCRQHGQSWHAITPVTAEDLPDGGICTFGRLSSNECGRDVLAGQPAVEQPAEAQPARVQWRVQLYDPLAKEWAPGAAFTTRERAEERLRMAHIHSPRWADDQTPVERRLVRETTTWTVEETNDTWVLSPENQAAETLAAADEETR